MRTELVLLDQGSLAPSLMRAAEIALNVADERVLEDHEMAIVEAFARAPKPALPLSTKAEMRGLIGSLAGVLRAPEMTADQAKLQREAYSQVLGDVELFRLQKAADHFLKTATWMPTPGEIRTMALTFDHDLWRAQRRARRLDEARFHRVTEEAMQRINRRALSQAELDALPDGHKGLAQIRGYLIETPEGGITYRTREALDRLIAHNEALTRQWRIENRMEIK